MSTKFYHEGESKLSKYNNLPNYIVDNLMIRV